MTHRGAWQAFFFGEAEHLLDRSYIMRSIIPMFTSKTWICQTNVEKTKRIVVDFRKGKLSHSPLIIDNLLVEMSVVSNFWECI